MKREVVLFVLFLVLFQTVHVTLWGGSRIRRVSITAAKVHVPTLSPPNATSVDSNNQRSMVERFARLLADGHHPEAHLSMFEKELDVSELMIPKIKFGVNPTLQDVFQKMKENFMVSAAAGGGDAKAPRNATAFIPLLALMCMKADFPMLLNLVYTLDIPVGSYSVVVNGAKDARMASLFALSLQLLLPGFVHATIFEENAGVSRGWNSALRLMVSAPVSFVVIANSDLMFSPDVQRSSLREALNEFSASPDMLIARFVRFAFFAVRSSAVGQLGFFDEVLFPAYGEDIDYFLRLRALGMTNDARFCRNFHIPVVHYESINIKENAPLYEQYLRGGRREYLMAKWGVDLLSVHNDSLLEASRPFHHPFNNPHVFVNNSWIVDEAHRNCTIHGDRTSFGKLLNCQFNLSLVILLEDEPLRVAI